MTSPPGLPLHRAAPEAARSTGASSSFTSSWSASTVTKPNTSSSFAPPLGAPRMRTRCPTLRAVTGRGAASARRSVRDQREDEEVVAQLHGTEKGRPGSARTLATLHALLCGGELEAHLAPRARQSSAKACAVVMATAPASAGRRDEEGAAAPLVPTTKRGRATAGSTARAGAEATPPRARQAPPATFAPVVAAELQKGHWPATKAALACHSQEP